MPDLRDRLHTLRARYGETLSAQLDTLEAHWRGVDVETVAVDDLGGLHLGLHRLAGSGATFGFAGISDIAQRLEGIVLAILREGAPFDEAARRDIRDGLVALRKAAGTSSADDGRPAPGETD